MRPSVTGCDRAAAFAVLSAAVAAVSAAGCAPAVECRPPAIEAACVGEDLDERDGELVALVAVCGDAWTVRCDPSGAVELDGETPACAEDVSPTSRLRYDAPRCVDGAPQCVAVPCDGRPRSGP